MCVHTPSCENRREAAKKGGLADAIQEFLKSPKQRDFWRVERAVLC